MPFDEGYPVSTPFSEGHPAYDHAMPTGTPLLAILGGVAAYAGWDDRFPVGAKDGRGLYVDVDHGILADGARWVSRMLHMTAIAVVVGQLVQTGQIVGLSGDTGLSTGPHLHTGVFRNGIAVDWLSLVR